MASIIDEGKKYTTHLGDGCYVRYTGYSFEFMANSHITPTDIVSLDVGDLASFIEWSKWAIEEGAKPKGEHST